MEQINDEFVDYVICRASFDAQELATNHPPHWSNANKKLVHELACPRGPASLSGTIHYARFKELPLPKTYIHVARKTRLEMREDAFTYDEEKEEATEGRLVVPWHKNFAHSHLFIAYSGGLFAQDEMQVAEHPALSSLREALMATRDKRHVLVHLAIIILNRQFLIAHKN